MSRKPKLTVPVSKEDEQRALERWRKRPKSQAVKVLPADAEDVDWLEARRHGIGASELAAVLDVPGAFQSSFSLWWAKKLGWSTERTFAMKVGTLLETTLGALFADERPDLMVCRPDGRLYRHPEHDWMLCTPDFLAVNEHGRVEPVECKSDEGGAWGPVAELKVPPKHRVQLHAQMRVYGAERGHLVRLAHKRMTVYTFEAAGLGDEEWAEWVDAGYRFMGSLDLGTPPDPDGSEATEHALLQLYPAPADPDPETGEDVKVFVDDELAAEFFAAHDAKEAAKARFALVRNQMRERMGMARFALRRSDSLAVAERRQYKKSGYEVMPHTVDEIRRRAW